MLRLACSKGVHSSKRRNDSDAVCNQCSANVPAGEGAALCEPGEDTHGKHIEQQDSAAKLAAHIQPVFSTCIQLVLAGRERLD